MSIRNQAMMASPKELAGKTLVPIRPQTFNILAHAGLMTTLTAVDGYDPLRDGFDPLWQSALMHTDPDRFEAMVDRDEMQEISAEARAWGNTWDWQQIGDAMQWLLRQSEMIAASMVVAQPGKANRVRKASRRTR